MITPISHPQKIKDLLAIDNMYESISYDGSVPLEEYNPTGAWFALLEGGECSLVTGYIHLQQLSNILWMPHIFIRKQFRGKGSEKWGIEVFNFMREQYGHVKGLAITPYRHAKEYAERIGFKQIGLLEKSIMKNGKLLDQYVLEL